MPTRTLLLYLMGAMLFFHIDGAIVIPNVIHYEDDSEFILPTKADIVETTKISETTTQIAREDVTSTPTSVDLTAMIDNNIESTVTEAGEVQHEGNTESNTSTNPIGNGTIPEEATTHADDWDTKCGMKGCSSKEICAEVIQTRCYKHPCISTFECHLKLDDETYKCGYNPCRIGQKCAYTGINCFLAPCYVSTECLEA